MLHIVWLHTSLQSPDVAYRMLAYLTSVATCCISHCRILHSSGQMLHIELLHTSLQWTDVAYRIVAYLTTIARCCISKCCTPHPSGKILHIVYTTMTSCCISYFGIPLYNGHLFHIVWLHNSIQSSNVAYRMFAYLTPVATCCIAYFCPRHSFDPAIRLCISPNNH